MVVERFYYSDKIEAFCTKETATILGELAGKAVHDINRKTTNSWSEEIEVMKNAVDNYVGRGSVFFEYNIPRMGKRVDVVLTIDNIVFVLEFKTAEQKSSYEAIIQVWDYALDLKNFHEGSLNRPIIPILVATNEKNKNLQLTLEPYEDGVYRPLVCNATKLNECIDNVIHTVHYVNDNFNDIQWANSGYEPTPTIIEAAVALYEHHTVADITKHGGDIDKALEQLRKIINKCREKNRKAVCFITGVPGAGKTLIGLNTAIDQYNSGEKAVYLSGNFPLVEVLQEALSRDYVRREKKRVEIEGGGKACSKKEARSRVKAFIQMIHHYRDLYIEGTEVRYGEIVPIEGYFRNHTDKSYIPPEHVAIFDEAQRAWTKDELQRFMKEKKGISDFPYSEPEYLISCMDRRKDWGVVVCLVGNGQSINKGEAGLKEWIESIHRRYSSWDVYMSEHLISSGEISDDDMNLITPSLILCDELHLRMSMRSFRSEKVSIFVNQLLNLDKENSKATLKELSNYPIVLTRSLETAKKWLKEHARGSERYGILASSKGERLKAININVRYQPDFVHWFLEDETDIRSSNALEDTLTEFKVQGLEIDWACVAWDADLRLNKQHTEWQHYQLRSGTKWQNINKEINQEYQINAYRVLLTRARQGMVIVVPEGDNGVPPDETRRPEWYDSIYKYLKDIGIQEI